LRRIASLLVVAGFVAAVVGCGSSSARLATCSFRNRGEAPPRAFGRGLAAELPDGSLVLGAGHRDGPTLDVVLRHVGQDCHVLRTTTVSVAGVTDGYFGGAIDAMVAAPDGQLLLAGTDGRRELVGRVLANGHSDRTFGHGGWSRFEAREKVSAAVRSWLEFSATSIAVAPSGSIFVGGNDGGAHCCVQDSVAELTPDGALAHGFGHGGSILIRDFGGSYTTNVAANADGSLYALGEYEQSGCGDPGLVRIEPGGSLDPRFDAAMARTLKRVAPPRFRFTPTLVPRRSGALALVGGFDQTCGPPLRRHTSAGGVAVGVLSSGRIDRTFGSAGVTRFPVAGNGWDGGFDSPLAIRLPSGRILATGYAYNRTNRPRGIVVRSFSPAGAPAGIRTIPRSKLPRRWYVDGLVPASDGGALLVVASATEIELIPVG
jgi:beta-propeller uncharacterized protein DUF5122